MTGWEKVGALTALYVVGMMWVNWTMIRAVRGKLAARAAWTTEEFDAIFADCDAGAPEAARVALAPWYGPGVVPKPEDTLRRFLKMDHGDVEDAVAAATEHLRLPTPEKLLPDLPDVAALVRYLDTLIATRPD